MKPQRKVSGLVLDTNTNPGNRVASTHWPQQNVNVVEVQAV